jgi:succinate dehydrogenase / fumarate reductase, cytochrome b subunit
MAAPPRPRPRPVYLNLLAIRMPAPAIASILHRISGAVLFFVGIPAALWALQSSLVQPEAFEAFRQALAGPFARLVLLGLVWAYLHHLFAGLRHVLQDVHIGSELQPARQTATLAIVAALVLTVIVAVRTW